LIFFFNFIGWMFGATIFGLCMWIRFDNDMQQWIIDLGLYNYWTGIYILLAGAALVLFVTFLGCCGSIMESRGLLGVFCGALAITFVVELAGAAYLLANGIGGTSLTWQLNSAILNYINEYDFNPQKSKILATVQSTIGCCGSTGSLDYDTVHKPVPIECRNPITGSEWTFGCVEAFTNFLEGISGWVAGIALVLCVLQIVGIIGAIVLIKKLKEEDEEGGRYDPVTVIKS